MCSRGLSVFLVVIAQSLKWRLEVRLPLALFPSPQGLMTGGFSHDPVTVATAPEHPG